MEMAEAFAIEAKSESVLGKRYPKDRSTKSESKLEKKSTHSKRNSTGKKKSRPSSLEVKEESTLQNAHKGNQRTN